MKIRKCKKCGKEFKPNIWNQVYCGSKTNKVGCSYWNININRTKRRLRDEMKKIGTVKGKVVAVSGYWNPLHGGHIQLFEEAKKLGEYLVVIVNNDEQVKLKGSPLFMDEKERMEIISALRAVDNVILSIDKDRTVCKTLELIKPDIFANGGDRTKNNIPETAVCKKIGCKMIFNVGRGGKIQSSSGLLEKFLNNAKK